CKRLLTCHGGCAGDCNEYWTPRRAPADEPAGQAPGGPARGKKDDLRKPLFNKHLRKKARRPTSPRHFPPRQGPQWHAACNLLHSSVRRATPTNLPTGAFSRLRASSVLTTPWLKEPSNEVRHGRPEVHPQVHYPP